MTPVTEVVLLLSLGINGRWLGNSIVSHLYDNPARLVQVAFSLLGATLLLIVGAFVLHFHGTTYIVDRSLCMISIVACGACLSRLMELLPHPWGHAPKKRKASR